MRFLDKMNGPFDIKPEAEARLEVMDSATYMNSFGFHIRVCVSFYFIGKIIFS